MTTAVISHSLLAEWTRQQVDKINMFSKLLALTAIVARATANWDPSDFAPQDVIHKDVVIIGGGASGTYAAVRLREDFNKSIVVVERDGHLVTRPLETVLLLLLTMNTGRTCQSHI